MQNNVDQAIMDAELNAIFEALRSSAQNLLLQGRTFGYRIGLSEAAIAAIRARHGAEAESVLAHCIVLQQV